MPKLPGPNYTIRHSLDRLERAKLIVEEEILERTKFFFGHPDVFGEGASFGVIDSEDPSSVLAGEDRPLSVSSNLTNNLNMDINPGIVVTQSGVFIKLDSIVRNVSLADPTEGVDNVVFLQYVLEDLDQEENDFKQVVVPFQVRPGDPDGEEEIDIQVGVFTVEDYEILTESSKENIVPLAIVATQTSVDPDTAEVSVDLAIDHTRDNYEYNRPWFSAQDIAHRSMRGTGTPTGNNPHAVGPNDLTYGDFSTFQTLANHGFILANDRTIAKVPGYRCQVSLPYSMVKTDDVSGTVTGYPSKKYVELPNYPIRLGRVWTESSGEDLGAISIPTTRIVVFPGDDPPTDQSIGVLFTKVDAAEPPASNRESIFSTSNPGEEELIVAGGLGFEQLASTQELFSDARKYPMVYELFIDGEATIRTTPQVVYCLKTLDAIGTSDTPEITQYGPAKIMMGLADASDVPSMSVKIRVYGTDSVGNDTNHLFEFTGPTWSDPGLPNPTIPSTSWTESLRVSDQVFSSITNIVIEERVDDGPNSAILLWAALNPFDTYDKMKDACHIAEVIWDGFRMSSVRDKRVIGTTVSGDLLFHEHRHPELELMMEALAGGNSTVFIEDFRAPRLHNLLHPWEDLQSQSIHDLVSLNSPWYTIGRLQPGLHGLYRSRGLPVFDGSGKVWRVTALPAAHNTMTPFTSNQPYLEYYSSESLSWERELMTLVTGTRNSYEVSLSAVPYRVRVAWDFTEGNTAFVLYG